LWRRKLRNQTDAMMVIGRGLRGFLAIAQNFTWRNIAIFVIALLIVSYLMLLGVIITVDRLMYVNWDHELDAPTVQPVRF
jgi:hypothetical protein